MKIAIVHDYLKEYGGAERVVETLHEMFPQAPIFVAAYDPKGLGPHAERIKKWDIRTTWIQKLPFQGPLLSAYRILAPAAFESLDLTDYDVVISSSAIYFAKAVITRPGALHLAYIHTPPKYLYGYATSFNYKKHWWTRLGAMVINHYLRLVDFETSQRPDVLIANSQAVAERINKFYRRKAEVIYPPVEVEKIKVLSRKYYVSGEDKKYFLALGRLWKGKGFNLIVEACTKANVQLKVAGSGPEEKSLRQIAGLSVDFLGQVTDEERIKLYTQAKALIVATEEEDFGITVVEAMAAGTPVLALRSGGYLETIQKGTTGEFFAPTVEDLIEALKSFKPQKYTVADCQKQAGKFSKEQFAQKISDLVQDYSQRSRQ